MQSPTEDIILIGLICYILGFKVAKNLLSKEGVIFISIDDSEIGNLRIVCDEIFGAENFCGVIKRRAARKTAFLSKRMTDMCDYVVAYVGSENAAPLKCWTGIRWYTSSIKLAMQKA